MDVDDSDPEQDVPSPIDLRDAGAARAWAARAEIAVPGRAQVRAAIAEQLAQLPPGARVLELGPGPGFLAAQVLARCGDIASYTLLDFSAPMLEMSRRRLQDFRQATYQLGDFKAPSWPASLVGPFAAVVAMQAVHELRHKRHAPTLYAQVRSLLGAGGLLLVADHTPKDASLRWTSLHMTAAEQRAAFEAAGFCGVEVIYSVGRLILVRGAAGPLGA